MLAAPKPDEKRKGASLCLIKGQHLLMVHF